MIDFRYHVVSLVAVFLALAVGIVIGTTTLNGPILADIDRRTSQLASTNNDLAKRNAALDAQLSAATTFDRALAPYAVSGLLADRGVVLVSAPGVSGDVRQQLSGLLVAAGARVSADVTLTGAWFDPAQDALLDSLAGRLAGSGAALPAGGSGQQRAAAELAAVLLGSGPGPLTAALQEYAAAGVLTVNGDIARPGSLAVVLAPAASALGDSGSRRRSAATALLELGVALDRRGAGAVLAGPEQAGSPPGALALATGVPAYGERVSAVQGVETVRGQLATVFALAGQLAGQAGTYTDPTAAVTALPTPGPSPSPR